MGPESSGQKENKETEKKTCVHVNIDLRDLLATATA